MKFLSPVVHDHPDVDSLLFNKSEGSYVIHRDKTRNNDRNPFTIHVVKKSHRTGWNIIAAENIHFDTQNQEYSFMKNRDMKYLTIESLIEDNKALLKFNLMLDLDLVKEELQKELQKELEKDPQERSNEDSPQSDVVIWGVNCLSDKEKDRGLNDIFDDIGSEYEFD